MIPMFYKEPEKQQRPYSSYAPYEQAPTMYPQRPAPVTERIPVITAQSPYASGSRPGAPWPQMPPAPQAKNSRMRGVAVFMLTCLLAVIFGIGLFAGWSFAHATNAAPGSPVNASNSSSPVENNASTLQSAQEIAIAKVEPSVVEIQGSTDQGVSLGSGVIIDHKGDIVTNNHVISGTSSLTVTLNNGSREAAQTIVTSPENDLAIIRMQPFANMQVATLGNSAQLTVGQEVLAIGNPLGYSGTATMGVVSALNRSAQESHLVHLTGLIQTSAPINPGNSGGALINLQGQVVGITTLSAINTETNTPANGLGFAIASNTVQSVVTRLLTQ